MDRLSILLTLMSGAVLTGALVIFAFSFGWYPFRRRRKPALTAPIFHSAPKALRKRHKGVTSTGRAQVCPHFAQQEISMLQCYGLAAGGPVLANVILPQRSQGSGGVREAFLRRSAERKAGPVPGPNRTGRRIGCERRRGLRVCAASGC
jgi:hypothetical protein